MRSPLCTGSSYTSRSAARHTTAVANRSSGRKERQSRAQKRKTPLSFLPALFLAQLRNMRDVMLPVPLVKEEQPVHRALTMFRVDENPRKMFGLQRAP